MSSSCNISVIIPCFNHGEFLQAAVASVTSIRRDDIELIVVDDGSTDERTRREMDALCALGIKVIRQENKGLAGARNSGVRASKGRYILPLDADDLLRPGWIARAIGILDSDTQVGVVYGDAQCFGTSTLHWIVGPFDTHRLLRDNFIHASALYRRTVWEQNDGYDGTMPVQGFEDWDFWIGALERGWRFAYLPEVFFEYRRAQDSMITRAVRSQDQVREFVARKHSLLYRQAWASLADERRSVKATLGNLMALLYSRGMQKAGALPRKAAKGLRHLRERLERQKAPSP
jgi:glycosyltransferase involved in cell wall biosynthesis